MNAVTHSFLRVDKLLWVVCVCAGMLVYGYRLEYDHLQGTQVVESYHAKLKGADHGWELWSSRRLDYTYHVLVYMVSPWYQTRQIQKCKGKVEVQPPFYLLPSLCAWPRKQLFPVLAGSIRNEHGDQVVQQALAAAETMSAQRVCHTEGKCWHFTAAAHAGAVWKACVDGAESTCSCPRFGSVGFCKHIAYGLRLQGVTEQGIIKYVPPVTHHSWKLPLITSVHAAKERPAFLHAPCFMAARLSC
jgi:hypothetical protein